MQKKKNKNNPDIEDPVLQMDDTWYITHNLGAITEDSKEPLLFH